MKKSVFAVTTLSFALASLAAWAAPGHTINVISCSQPGADTGYQLSIQMNEDGKTGVADISEETIAGPRPVQNYDVKLKPSKKAVFGAPQLWKGTDFSFGINWTVGPSANGKRVGHLRATTKSGNKIQADDLQCSMEQLK